MKNVFIVIGAALAAAVCLAGCVSLGISQPQSEQAYTVAAVAVDVALNSGKVTGDAIKTTCQVDVANYSILISTRNPADGVPSYAPADTAHATVQASCTKLGYPQ